MEINGPRRVETAPIRKTRQTSKSDGPQYVSEESAEAQRPTALTGTSPIAALDTILALQGIDEWGDPKSRGIGRGELLLNLLDEVRDGLLAGGIPRLTLNRLALAIAKRREGFSDPKLQTVLDEIDLRARVELAKLEMAERPVARMS